MNAPQDLLLEAVGKNFGTISAVTEINLAVSTGKYVVLLGPSGSGKTTVLSMIGGFTPPSRGIIRLGGLDVTDLPPSKRPTATVFQDYALFPHMTVGDNVAFGLAVRGMARDQRQRRAVEALSLVELAGFENRRIHELSGGQRQRVALARALIVEPAVLLLDEPLGALDLHLRRAMQDELKRLQRLTGRTFVHVTHDQEEAMALADIVVIMNDGRVEDLGPPDRVYARPATRFTATFMGESNLIEGRIAERLAGRVVVDTPHGRISLNIKPDASTKAGVMLAIRPENLRLKAAGPGEFGIGDVRVREIVFQGSYVRIVASAEADRGQILLKVSASENLPRIGDLLSLSIEPSAIVLLDGC